MIKNIIIAALMAALIFAVILSFRPKSPGSFEYIRKGAALLEKSDFRDSIKYFEKAHAESPENAVIKNNLVYAYSRYAADLANRKKFDDAIVYLIKARDISPGAPTLANLASMYSKRAVFDARKGEWSRATEDLERAQNAVTNSINAKRGLSYSLFSDAAEEYKLGNDRLAIILAETALSVYPSARLLEFAGDLYYKRSDLDTALDFYRKAILLDPEKSSLADKIGKCERSLELSGVRSMMKSKHFELIYEGEVARDINLHKISLEKAYYDIGKDLAHFPSTRTKVFFYTQRDFRNVFRMPGITRAFYDGNIRIPMPDEALAVPTVIRYLYHEYTHAVVSSKTNGNCSVWFSEGLAVWEELGKCDPPAVDLAVYLKNAPQTSIADIERAFIDQGKKDLRLYYLLAYTVIKYIVDTWGENGIRAVLERNAKGQHVINAIDDQFLLSEHEFNDRWQEYLRTHYTEKIKKIKEGTWQNR